MTDARLSHTPQERSVFCRHQVERPVRAIPTETVQQFIKRGLGASELSGWRKKNDFHDFNFEGSGEWLEKTSKTRNGRAKTQNLKQGNTEPLKSILGPHFKNFGLSAFQLFLEDGHHVIARATIRRRGVSGFQALHSR